MKKDYYQNLHFSQNIYDLSKLVKIFVKIDFPRP